ncbi:MAG: PD-(D/E)XK nuclease family protein [bacterium]
MYEILADVKDIEKYSYSKLSTYYTCPYSYKLNYIDKVYGVSNGFSKLGGLVHSILERYLKGEILQFELVDIFEEEFEKEVGSVKLRMAKFTRDLTDNYKEKCKSFLAEFVSFDGLEIVAVEENFNLLTEIKDKKIFLNGFIDVIAKDKDDNYYVIDWKSKSAFKSKEELKQYARQLYLYSIWVKYKYGKFPKQLRFVQFKIDHTEIIDFDEQALEETMNWVYTTLNLVENEQFWIETCDDFFSRNLCNFRFICPYSAIVKED